MEEAAATVLELHEAQLAADAQAVPGGESAARVRHRKLMQQVPEAI